MGSAENVTRIATNVLKHAGLFPFDLNEVDFTQLGSTGFNGEGNRNEKQTSPLHAVRLWNSRKPSLNQMMHQEDQWRHQMYQEDQWKQGSENIHHYVTKAQSGNEALEYFNKKEEEKNQELQEKE